jgi:hypothetical protein
MRIPLLVLLLGLSACGGTDPAPPDDDDDGGGNPLPPTYELVRPKNDGSNQEGEVGKSMPLPFVVRIMDEGSPVAGISVNWTGITQGSTMDPAVSQSDAYGYTSSTYRAAQTIGRQSAKVTLGTAVEFYAVEIVAGPPVGMTVISTVDSVQVNSLMILRVKVVDVYGNGVENFPTAWAMTGGPVDEFIPGDSTEAGGISSFIIFFGPAPTSADVTVSLPTMVDIPPIVVHVKSY